MQKKPTKKRLTKRAKLDLIQGSGGLLTDIAKLAGVDRTTVYRWREADDDIKQAIAAERTTTTDKAERVVIDAIDAGDLNAAKYWLSTIGKDRGFSTRTEVESTGPTTPQIVIYEGKAPDDSELPKMTGGARICLPHNGRE